jgi:hypothetical protein
LIVDHLNILKMTPKVFPQTRQTKSHAVPMIMLVTTQIRQVDDDPLYRRIVDDALYQILNHFVKPNEHALLKS